MPVYFEVDNTSFTYSLQVIPLDDASDLDQSELLKNIAVYISNLKIRHDNAIEKSGKILGQERIKFVELIDKLLTLLITFLDSIKENFPKDILTLEDEINLKVSIENKNKKFYSNGVLNEEEINNLNSFNIVHAILVNNVKEVLLKYKEIMGKSESSPDIYKGLLIAFDDIFYNLIIFRHNIKNCIIDR